MLGLTMSMPPLRSRQAARLSPYNLAYLFSHTIQGGNMASVNKVILVGNLVR
jgi:hypothetical protein